MKIVSTKGDNLRSFIKRWKQVVHTTNQVVNYCVISISCLDISENLGIEKIYTFKRLTELKILGDLLRRITKDNPLDPKREVVKAESKFGFRLIAKFPFFERYPKFHLTLKYTWEGWPYE